MSYVERIIARFGGVRPLARKLSKPEKPCPPTTVQSWKDTGFIPAHRQQEVLEAGQDLTPPLRTDDFFSSVPETARSEVAA